MGPLEKANQKGRERMYVILETLDLIESRNMIPQEDIQTVKDMILDLVNELDDERGIVCEQLEEQIIDNPEWVTLCDTDEIKLSAHPDITVSDVITKLKKIVKAMEGLPHTSNSQIPGRKIIPLPNRESYYCC